MIMKLVIPFIVQPCVTKVFYFGEIIYHYVYNIYYGCVQKNEICITKYILLRPAFNAWNTK